MAYAPYTSVYSNFTTSNQEYFGRLTDQASAVTWVFFSLDTFFFGLRLVARAIMNQEAAGWDDAVISLSWVIDSLVIRTMKHESNFNIY
jgi:hypothetical protein